MTDEVETGEQQSGAVSWEEWRVTGDPGHGYPPYDFTFGSRTRRLMNEDADPESSAREFVEQITAGSQQHPELAWIDGPHLSRRTVTETAWEAVE